MKIKEVILGAMAKTITWWQAAKIHWHQCTVDEDDHEPALLPQSGSVHYGTEWTALTA